MRMLRDTATGAGVAYDMTDSNTVRRTKHKHEDGLLHYTHRREQIGRVLRPIVCRWETRWRAEARPPLRGGAVE